MCWGFPEMRTSGTENFSKICGREYCGYSFFRQSFIEKDSSSKDFLESTPSISRTSPSINTKAEISPLERTYCPMEISEM